MIRRVCVWLLIVVCLAGAVGVSHTETTEGPCRGWKTGVCPML